MHKDYTDKIHRRDFKNLKDFKEHLEKQGERVSEIQSIVDIEKDTHKGFIWVNKKNETIKIYYHAPSLCFCREDENGNVRELSFNFSEN
jgi:predicted RND superfamily exporter protein